MQQVRAVLALRVSSEEQAENGTSLETQELACLRKAAELGAQVVCIYRDEGISGALYLSREGIQAALADIDAGRANMLIVFSISRLSRDVEHQQIIKKRIERAGARLVICDMPLEDTAEGELMFGISGTFAQYERKLIRKRTMSGRRQRAIEGQQPVRAKSAFGYHMVTKADVLRGQYPADQIGKYQVNPIEAPWAEEIFRRYSTGVSLRQICFYLDHEGILPPQGGRCWRPQSLRVILMNPLYKGDAAFGRTETIRDEARKLAGGKCDYYFRKTDPEHWVTIDAPALVDDATWAACQARLQDNRTSNTGPKRKYMLASLVYCAECGRRMYSHRSHTTLYYRCGVPMAEAQHKPKAFNAAKLEEQVTQTFVAGVRNPHLTESALAGFARRQAEIQPTCDFVRVKEELKALEAKEKAAVAAQVAGIQQGVSPEAYRSVFTEIAAERKSLTSRLEQENARQSHLLQFHPKTDAEKLQAVFAAVEETLTSEDITPAEKQVILARVIEKIIPTEEGVTIQLKSVSSEFVHIVLFKWKPDATPEAIIQVVEGLRGLKDKIPGIVDLSCGENFSDRSQGFTHGLVVRFADRAALEAYGPSEAHQHVVQNFIAPIRVDVLAVDYEV